MKRVLLPLLAAMVAMLAVAAVAGGHGSKPHRSLQLVGTEASYSFVDVEPKQAGQDDPPTPGDSFLTTETLTKGGEAFGTLYVQCTFVTPEANQCLATFELPNGQITAQGVLHDTSDFTVAVTGGTGAYFAASGSIDGHEPQSEGGSSMYTINFR
jgi:hypothetical protein